MPVLRCQFDVCTYAASNDKSYWLATNKERPMMPPEGNAITQYISRCKVCEAPGNVIAIHSQSSKLPSCPDTMHWKELWSGYSFALHTGAGAQGGGQSLSSPGSCLQHFNNMPFIECTGGGGSCNFHAGKYSFWLVASDKVDNYQSGKQSTLTLKSGGQKAYISRCVVCMKKKSKMN